MELYNEQILRDEVIYLHSLWHKGPPRNPTSHFNPVFNFHNPNRKPLFNPQYALHQPLITPSFKNNNGGAASTSKKKKRTKKKKKKKKKVQSESDQRATESSDAQWWSKSPVEETLDSTTGWPELKVKSVSARRFSVEEQDKSVSNQMQCKGLDACRAFFAKKCGSGSEEDDEGDDDDDMEEDMDDDEDDDDCEKCVEYDFLLKLFMKDSDLRRYYEKNHENGEFYCLICGGIGKKVWKKYKNVVAIVQHSTAISKTAKRRAHRAYGLVICKVLGWDINRLPTIVLSVNDTLSHSLAKIEDPNVDANGTGDTSLSKKKDDSSAGKNMIVGNYSTGSMPIGTSESVICEDASNGSDASANSNVEDSVKEITEQGVSVEKKMNCSEMLREYEDATIQIEQRKITTETIDHEGSDEDGTNPKKNVATKLARHQS